MKARIYTLLILLIASCQLIAQSQILIKNITLIDGNGKEPLKNVDILLKGDKIINIGKDIKSNSSGIKVMDMSGKTIMPLMTNAHGHLAQVKGTTTSAANFTKANVVKELRRYQSYGVGNILSMGTDQPSVFSLREESRANKLPGATLFTAGYGFRTPVETMTKENELERYYRPATATQAAKDIKVLAALRPDVIKIWVDRMGPKGEKMTPEVYKVIIHDAHEKGIRVAAHLYYLSDAHELIEAGADIFAHSVRDQQIDDALIAKMKAKNTIYIPTLTRDGFEIFFASNPSWINEPSFKNALEPGVYEMVTSQDYKNKIENSTQYQNNVRAYNMAIYNLRKVFDAGILVALGTDSGAFPVRAQGFSEHLELELMVAAGLTPLQAITIATRNSAEVLNLLQHEGTLEIGKKANFIVLNEDPTQNIKSTRAISSVWKNGVVFK